MVCVSPKKISADIILIGPQASFEPSPGSTHRYTKGATPEQTRDQIIALLDR